MKEKFFKVKEKFGKLKEKASQVIDRKKMISFAILIVLFCTYIFPTGFINASIPFDKAIFSLFMILFYFYDSFVLGNKIKKSDIIFIFLCVLLFFLSRTVNFLLFITLLFARRMVQEKDTIVEYLKKSKILYICFIFTIFYSILNFGQGGRYAFAAIREINQSGLAIFFLGLMLLLKNKKLGYFTLAFGVLTFSRSYYLAILLFFTAQLKFVKNLLSKKFVTKNIKHLNYFNITVLSSIVLIFVGFFFIWQYKLGNIVESNNLASKIHLLDASNFYRFVANVTVFLIAYQFPKCLFLGMSAKEYKDFGKQVFQMKELPYKYVNPHNLFFSHLKMYGLFSIVETIYISRILKNLVNKNNLFIYFGIVLYSIILGAGCYSYWLYLSIFVLSIYFDEVRLKN